VEECHPGIHGFERAVPSDPHRIHPAPPVPNRDRGRRFARRSRPTPPDKRVRIRRFEKLRLRAEPGQSQLVEPAVWESEMKDHR
jgi:hypothetical protein